MLRRLQASKIFVCTYKILFLCQSPKISNISTQQKYSHFEACAFGWPCVGDDFRWCAAVEDHNSLLCLPGSRTRAALISTDHPLYRKIHEGELFLERLCSVNGFTI